MQSPARRMKEGPWFASLEEGGSLKGHTVGVPDVISRVNTVCTQISVILKTGLSKQFTKTSSKHREI